MVIFQLKTMVLDLEVTDWIAFNFKGVYTINRLVHSQVAMLAVQDDTDATIFKLRWPDIIVKHYKQQ